MNVKDVRRNSPLLGVGTRQVFDLKDGTVLKVGGDIDNRAERNFWEAIKDTYLAAYFAPVVEAHPRCTWLRMVKLTGVIAYEDCTGACWADDCNNEDLQIEMEDVADDLGFDLRLADLHCGNWGLDQFDNLVVLDYAFCKIRLKGTTTKWKGMT